MEVEQPVNATKRGCRMIAQKVIEGEEIRELVQTVVQTELGWQAEGYVVTTAMLADVLLKAASQNTSLEGACRDWTPGARGTRLRGHIVAHLERQPLRALEGDLTSALAARVPAELYHKAVAVALDMHDEPCYAKSDALRTHSCRAPAKQGTTHFVRIATAYVIWRQIRFTLALTFVLPEDKPVEVVRRRHEHLKRCGLHTSGYYLDRAFCGGTVITYLQQLKQAAIIACTIRGVHGGTRQLCRGRKRYVTPYTFTDGTAATLVVVATRRKRKRHWLVFVMIELNWSPHRVQQHYRGRFAIESTYRLLRQTRIRSCARPVRFRFFLLGFALLLVNLWTYLRWFVARCPGPGPHRLHKRLFPLQIFLALLRRTLDRLYGVVESVPLFSPCPAFSIY